VENILITLCYAKDKEIDMKIPSYMTVEEFTEIVCQIYGVSGSTIQAEPLGILLNKKQTFIEQQVEHGALLTFS